MKLFLGFVLYCLCVNVLKADEIYRVGLVQDSSNYLTHIYEAGKQNADIVVVSPVEQSNTLENYEQIIESLSEASKQAGSYLVAHLAEKMQCQNKQETVRSNVVLDRKGSVIAEYRKPQNAFTNCTSSPSELVTFDTDFGITFGLMMEEDLVLKDLRDLKDLKNFVVLGAWPSDGTFLNAAELASPWAYSSGANLLTTHGIFSGKSGAVTGDGKLVAELSKDGSSVATSAPVIKSTAQVLKDEELRQYVTRPLDLEASSTGHKESVCDRTFCCEFYVKTGVITSPIPKTSLSLAAFDGVQNFGAGHKIGEQNCVLLGSSQNTTNIIFEAISISANFTKDSSQFPIIQSSSVLPTEKFNFETKTEDISKQVTLTVSDAQNVNTIGIFGRDFSKDAKNVYQNEAKNNADDFYGTIFNEDVQEFFDYVWIRLRIMLVVVSIYVLEML